MGTEVRLPPTLLYPVEIVNLLAPPKSAVKRHDRLIKFKYWNRVPDGVSEEGEEPNLITKEFYGTFDSPHDGTLVEWRVKPGDRLNDNVLPVVVVAEGCDHSVQYGGLCALCGRSLDDKDWMGYSDVDRAPIAMSHDTAGLTVSREEAERIESWSTKQLLADRRLVLVVDLDQTVIHASVNPEIDRWLTDEEAPQHEAVAGVRKFALREHGQLSYYYVKLRPGLHEFLESMSSKYEMHVYTMATKQYALEIAKVIDPEGKYFADRILSRDSSGNLLHKDLRRLFPVTTQMVTVIDDRGDVWNWSPNLVRVVPYHFWSNTGDINSQFLPKRSGLLTPDMLADGGNGVATGPEGDADSSATPDATPDASPASQTGEFASHDNDAELRSIGDVLAKLHAKFYTRYDPANRHALPDVGKLLPALKLPVFNDCVLLFSGFFPLGTTDLDSTDIVQWVRSFGAVVVADFLPSVTHVVARNAGTMKARQAAGHKKLVVGIEWVFRCLESWTHVDEEPYVFKVPNPLLPEEEPDENAQSGDEMDPNIADGFMRSLQRGDVNWDEMDEELKELLDGEDDDDDDEGNAHNEGNADNEGNAHNADNDNEDNEDNDNEDNKDNKGNAHNAHNADEGRDKHNADQLENNGHENHENDDGSEGFESKDETLEEPAKNEESLKRKRDESDEEFGLDEDWD